MTYGVYVKPTFSLSRSHSKNNRTQIEKHLKQFINFIDNEVNPVNNKDYLYSLKQIIETVIGKKEKNKYLKYETT